MFMYVRIYIYMFEIGTDQHMKINDKHRYQWFNENKRGYGS